MLKKLILIVIGLFLISNPLLFSCSKENEEEKESTSKLSVDSSTVLDEYYVDEFNVTDIYLNYFDGKDTYHVMLLPSMIRDYPDTLEAGTYDFVIYYADLATSVKIKLINKEVYSKGLSFVKNSSGTYSVFSYNGTEKDVIIPDTYQGIKVTMISDEAFKNKEIDSITLSNNLETIEKNAFFASTIKEINFPDSLKEIDEGAFDECVNLTSVYLPKSIEFIGSKAFYVTSKIIMETEVPVLGYAKDFYNENHSYLYLGVKKTSLSKINNLLIYTDDLGIQVLDDLGTSEEVNLSFDSKLLITIGAYAFENHEELKKVTFSNNVTKIGAYAFQKCSIEEVTLPSSITSLGEYAFSNCGSLTSLSLNEGLTELPIGLCSACFILEKVNLPSTLRKICSYAFQNCYALEETFIPASVEVIGDGAFYANRVNIFYIESETIPEGWSKTWNPTNRPYYLGQTK